MFYAHLHTIKNRQICLSSSEQEIAPDESLPWIPYPEPHPEVLGCEWVDGKFVRLSEDEMKELFAE